MRSSPWRGCGAVSGPTGEKLKQLSGLALQLGKDTVFSAKDAALGLEEMVKGGIKIPDILNGGAKAILNLASAGGVALPDAAEIGANALSMFGLKGEDLARVSDLIAGAANASSLSVTDFKFSLAAAGAVAAGSGQTIDDLSQAIAVMGAAGIKGSDAGTSLKTMLGNLQPTTKAQVEQMRELGLITVDQTKLFAALRQQGIDPRTVAQKDQMTALMMAVTGWDGVKKMTTEQKEVWADASEKLGVYENKFIDANGKFKSMAEIAELLQTHTEGLTDAQRMQALETIFGSDAIRAATIFAKEGGEGFAQMAADMGKVTAEAVGMQRLDNLAGSWEQLKGSLETAAITLGQHLLPSLRGLVDWGTRAVNGAIPLIEQYGPKLAAGLAVGGQSLATFGKHVASGAQ